jgi:hypothetical protein
MLEDRDRQLEAYLDEQPCGGGGGGLLYLAYLANDFSNTSGGGSTQVTDFDTPVLTFEYNHVYRFTLTCTFTVTNAATRARAHVVDLPGTVHTICNTYMPPFSAAMAASDLYMTNTSIGYFQSLPPPDDWDIENAWSVIIQAYDAGACTLVGGKAYTWFAIEDLGTFGSIDF